jgi:hypothetical protein
MLKRNDVHRTADRVGLRRNRRRLRGTRVHPVVTHFRRVPRFSPRSTRSCW